MHCKLYLTLYVKINLLPKGWAMGMGWGGSLSLADASY